MVFNRKYDLERHMNRITDCVTGSKTKKIKKNHSCKDCKQKFTRKDALMRHTKICKKKINKIMNNNNSNILNTKGKTNNLALKSANCNNKINIENVIIFTFGKDGIKNISPKDLSKIINSNDSIFESMVRNVNLNPNKPQHHNVFYGNMQSSYGQVYENKEWVTKKIDEMLDTLIDAKREDLGEILNEMEDILNKKARNKIKEAIENMDWTNPRARKKLKSYLKPILYNHRDLIIKTRKLTEEQEEEIFRKEQEEAEREAEEEEREIEHKKKLKKKKSQKRTKKESEDDN